MENQASEIVLPPQKPKSNFAVWIVVGIAILTAGIGIGLAVGKYLQPTSSQISVSTPVVTPTRFPVVTPVEPLDPTANWKTYLNTKHTYSFKYPDNYRVEQNGMISPNPGISDQIAAFDATASDPIAKPRFTVSVKTGDKNELPVESKKHFSKVSTYSFQKIKFNLGYTAEDNKVVSDLSSTIFQGVPAFTYTIRGSYVDDGAVEAGSPSTTRKYLWLEKQGDLFLIVVDDQNPSNQILSTFKFLE